MKKSICKHCTFYHAMYEKFSSSFSRLNHGSCIKLRVCKNQNETCDNFVINERKEKMRKEMMLKALERALDSINSISIILNERDDI